MLVGNIVFIDKKNKIMRRYDYGCWGIIGYVVLIIMIISEAFKGNFTPLLVILGITFIIYAFFKIIKLKQDNKISKDKIISDVNSESNPSFPRSILILILLGLFLGGFYLNNSSKSNIRNQIVSVDDSAYRDVVVDTVAIDSDVLHEINWVKNDFMNTTFQVPNNLPLDENLSTDKLKTYINFDLNISMTIVADYLTDEMIDKTIDDFDISIVADNINNENKRNFDDFKLLNYEMTNLGNSKAIKIEESSKKVSGLKNIKMIIVSYHVILKPYYYKVTFSYPQENSRSLEIFEQINKTFDFDKISDNANIEINTKVNNDVLGNYVVTTNLIDKVYLYRIPDDAFKKKAYLVGNEIVFVEKIIDGFGYIEYTNIRGLKSKGWVKMCFLIKSEN